MASRETSEVVQNLECKVTLSMSDSLPKSIISASDLRSADCSKQEQPSHTKKYPWSQSKGDSVEMLKEQITRLKSEKEALNATIAHLKRDNERIETEYKNHRDGYQKIKEFLENSENSTTERKLNQSSPMDEAQKEHPLITATNVGHPEVKQEIEAFFRKVRHELPTSVHSCSKTEMWQNITKAFQEIFSLIQKKMLDHLHQKLCEEFREQKISSDTMKAYSYLLNATSKKEASDDFIRDVYEEVLKLPIVNDQQELTALLKEMIYIAWKMMTLNPPLLPSQPDKYKEEMHDPFHRNWKVAIGPFDLIYYLPVIIYADSGHVACKGLVGNKPSESPDCPNYAELSDSDNDSEDEVFKESCKAPDTSTTNKTSDLNAASTCCFYCNKRAHGQCMRMIPWIGEGHTQWYHILCYNTSCLDLKGDYGLCYTCYRPVQFKGSREFNGNYFHFDCFQELVHIYGDGHCLLCTMKLATKQCTKCKIKFEQHNEVIVRTEHEKQYCIHKRCTAENPAAKTSNTKRATTGTCCAKSTAV